MSSTLGALEGTCGEVSEDDEHAESTAFSEVHPVPVDKFLSNNSELFTIIGIFAGVSFYFVQFDEAALEHVEIGLVSSLVIYIIVGLVALNKILEQISNAINNGSALYSATYTILGISFLGLILSIYYALQSYAPAINPNLAALGSLAVVVYYTIGIISGDGIANIEGWWFFEVLAKYSPHVAGFWLFVSWSQTQQGGLQIIDSSEGGIFIFSLSLILTHFVLMTFILGVAVIGERVRKALKSLREPCLTLDPLIDESTIENSHCGFALRLVV